MFTNLLITFLSIKINRQAPERSFGSPLMRAYNTDFTAYFVRPHLLRKHRKIRNVISV